MCFRGEARLGPRVGVEATDSSTVNKGRLEDAGDGVSMLDLFVFLVGVFGVFGSFGVFSKRRRARFGFATGGGTGVRSVYSEGVRSGMYSDGASGMGAGSEYSDMGGGWMFVEWEYSDGAVAVYV